MTSWLDPLRMALASRRAPATIFFRDDDVGPADERLYRLVDLFALYRVPLDLAVIPAHLDPAVAGMLAERRDRLGLHQHGYAHVNHEPVGRSCEFGPTRASTDQLGDLAAGRRRLRELFGAACDPFFTPPWNRCTQATVNGLRALGFSVLSRSRGAPALDATGLAEIDIDVDWVKLAAPAAITVATAAIAKDGRCGVMLHHAVMTEEHWATLERFLDCVSRHSRVRTVLMRDIARSVIAPTEVTPS